MDENAKIVITFEGESMHTKCDNISDYQLAMAAMKLLQMNIGTLSDYEAKLKE